MIIVYTLSTGDTKITIRSVDHNNSFIQYQLSKMLRCVLERGVIKFAQ